MNQLLHDDLWPKLRSLSATANNRQAAVAYVTDDRFLQFGKGDVLVTDASDRAIMSGQTSAALLKRAFDREAEVYSLEGLHAKVFVMDRFAIIGSANLTKNSENLDEAALLTDQPSVVGSTLNLIDSLKEKGELVGSQFLKRILKLPVKRSGYVPHGNRRTKEKVDQPRSWLIRTDPIVRSRIDDSESYEAGYAEAQSYEDSDDGELWSIRLRGKSPMQRRVKRNDQLVWIWSGGPKEEPRAVWRHAPIAHVEHDKKTGTTWVYVRYPADADETALTWKQFQKLYSRLGISRELGHSICRELSRMESDALNENWPGV